MIAAPVSETRQISVTLPAPAGGETGRRLQADLLALPAVEAVEVHDRQCRIRYAFPDMSFDRLWPCLRAAAGMTFPLTARLRYGLAAFLEENERDARLHAGGWHRCIDCIHAHRFDPLQVGSSDTRRQQWQQYESRRRGTTD